MPNFNDVGMLLHLKEKLMGHPKLAAMMAHVDAALENHAAEATHEELPEKRLTKQEEEAAEAAKEAEALRQKEADEAAAREKAALAEKDKPVSIAKADAPADGSDPVVPRRL